MSWWLSYPDSDGWCELCMVSGCYSFLHGLRYYYCYADSYHYLHGNRYVCCRLRGNCNCNSFCEFQANGYDFGHELNLCGRQYGSDGERRKHLFMEPCDRSFVHELLEPDCKPSGNYNLYYYRYVRHRLLGYDNEDYYG